VLDLLTRTKRGRQDKKVQGCIITKRSTDGDKQGGMNGNWTIWFWIKAALESY